MVFIVLMSLQGDNLCHRMEIINIFTGIVGWASPLVQSWTKTMVKLASLTPFIEVQVGPWFESIDRLLDQSSCSCEVITVCLFSDQTCRADVSLLVWVLIFLACQHLHVLQNSAAYRCWVALHVLYADGCVNASRPWNYWPNWQGNSCLYLCPDGEML